MRFYGPFKTVVAVGIEWYRISIPLQGVRGKNFRDFWGQDMDHDSRLRRGLPDAAGGRGGTHGQGPRHAWWVWVISLSRQLAASVTVPVMRDRPNARYGKDWNDELKALRQREASVVSRFLQAAIVRGNQCAKASNRLQRATAARAQSGRAWRRLTTAHRAHQAQGRLSTRRCRRHSCAGAAGSTRGGCRVRRSGYAASRPALARARACR